ncbi:hypothetical protein Tco_0294960 [Tanacetum coccineum]
MSSLTDSICYGGSGTTADGGDGSGDGSNGGKGDLDLLRDKDGENDGGGKVLAAASCMDRSDGDSKDDDGKSSGDGSVQLSIDLWLLCSLVALRSPFLVDGQRQG